MELKRVKPAEPGIEVDRHEGEVRESMIVPRIAEETQRSATHPVLSKAHSGIETAKLSYRLIRPARAVGIERWRLAQAYRCWDAVWSETLRELDNVTRIFSDDFTRQDELGALFHLEQCIGLTGFRWVDLSLAHHRGDSYFKAWPEPTLRALVANGSQICIGSNLTVLPEWRGIAHGFSVKSILMRLAVKRFLDSDADAMAGTMRNDRGMNGLVYQLGAMPLVTDVTHHGVKVDLVMFSRRSGPDRSVGDDGEALAERLWEQVNTGAGKPNKRIGRQES